MRRRDFLSLAALGSAGALRAATLQEKRVRAEVVFESPGPMPNGLQATAEGLWLLDQEDNHAYLVDFADGSLKRRIPTASDRGSGIGFDGQSLWLASTYDCRILKTHPVWGKTVGRYPTPGCGKVKWGSPTQDTGAHGIQFHEGKMWLAVPPSMTIYRIDTFGFRIEHEIPAPGERPHGLGWRGGFLWCTESNHKAFYMLNPETGEQLAKLQLGDDDPVPHGMTIWEDQMWYCDADTRAVCRVAV